MKEALLMSERQFLWAILAMAGVMMLFRIVPLLFCKKKIKNQFIQSFLAYVPCAVLTSMLVPEAFNSTANFWSAIGGVIVAAVLAYFERSLIVVAISSAVAVFIIERIIHMANF